MRLALFALAVFLVPSPAFAWGAGGHELIVDAAYNQLTPAARSEFDRLLAAGPLHVVEGCSLKSHHDVATWPDCVRSKDPFKATYDEHFDDIPLFGRKPKRDYCPNKVCATEAIKRNRAILASKHASDGERLEALSFLVHYVGDIHQPLHAADNDDRGGNDVPVTYLGAETYVGYGGRPTRFNLHGIWDSPIADAAMAGNGRSAIETSAASHRRSWSSTDPDRWAREAHRIAQRYAYGRLSPTILPKTKVTRPVAIDQRYVDDAVPVVQQQMAKAIARLVTALNKALLH